MESVFVDTAGWIALLNTDDALHRRAVVVRKRLLTSRTPIVTTEFVLIEVADALCSPARREATVAFLRAVRSAPGVTVIGATSALYESGLALFAQRPDKDWGLTDCISFNAMREAGITQALTSDHHFEQAGLTKLL